MNDTEKLPLTPDPDEPTTPLVYGPPTWRPEGPLPAPPPAPPTAFQPTAAAPRRGRFVAGVLTAALVVGGGAGIGGAAVYDALTEDPAGTGNTTSTTTRTSTSGVAPAPALDGSVESVAETVLPSVVQIVVSGARGQGSGSGVILSEDGRILTNEHVVASVAEGGGTLRVGFDDGTRVDATVLGTDPLTDLAVIQAEGVSGLTPATLGASSSLRIGQSVVAVGSPFGLESTVTTGIVSALDRAVDVGSDGNGNATVYPAIQTDAAINPGNSGGPLVDLNGAVVGINSSIRTGSAGSNGSIGLGFAIPIDDALPIIEQIENGEKPTHARLGISVLSGGLEAGEGAEIGDVGADSTAARAGLRTGDIITSVDQTRIVDADSLIATIRSYRPGDSVEITWLRDGEEQSAELVLDSDG